MRMSLAAKPHDGNLLRPQGAQIGVAIVKYFHLIFLSARLIPRVAMVIVALGLHRSRRRDLTGSHDLFDPKGPD
jgi:hypothetical protein